MTKQADVRADKRKVSWQAVCAAFSILCLTNVPAFSQDTSPPAARGMDERYLSWIRNHVRAKFARREFQELILFVNQAAPEARSDVEVLYFLGVAYLSLPEGTGEALGEKHLRESASRERSTVRASFALARHFLKKKRWSEAKALFTEIEKKITSTHPRYPELLYYQGVSMFFTGELFEGRERLTRALWTRQLDDALEQSAREFLQEIVKHRPWEILIPVGLQYDGNMFGTRYNEVIPLSLWPNRGFRIFYGSTFVRFPVPLISHPKLKTGYSFGIFNLQNLEKKYSALDLILLDGGASQVMSVGEESEIIFSEHTSLTLSEKKLSSFTLGVKAKYRWFELGTLFDADLKNKKEENLTHFVFSEKFETSLSLTEKMSANFHTDLHQQIYTKRAFRQRDAVSALIGTQFSYQLNPQWTMPFGTSGKWSMTRKKEHDFRLGARAGSTYAFTTFLMTSLSGSFEVQLTKSDTILRPEVNWMWVARF